MKDYVVSKHVSAVVVVVVVVSVCLFFYLYRHRFQPYEKAYFLTCIWERTQRPLLIILAQFSPLPSLATYR